MYSVERQIAYNAWASGKIAEILSTVDSELLEREIVSSFPSIKKTLLHIWDAELIWLLRVQGKSLTGWPSESFKGGKTELIDGFLNSSKNIATFFSGKGQQYFESKIIYKNMKGVEFTSSVEEILFHVTNHGSFHRGQIITMLRQLGFEKLSPQDLIVFTRL